jgi:hypothetical protein
MLAREQRRRLIDDRTLSLYGGGFVVIFRPVEPGVASEGPVRDFDQRFDDPPGYILGITKEIWEDRSVERLREYYTDDIPVRSPDGYVIGNEAVIKATHATLVEFPNRQLLGEDVIWSDDGDRGFLSSHRIFSTATHLGDGAFGSATGRELRYRVIADCAARANQIYDEWLVRDGGAIVRQLGFTPEEFAGRQIEEQRGADQAVLPLMSQSEPPEVYVGKGNDHPAGQRYAQGLEQLITADDVDVTTIYDRAANLELPGGYTGHGWADAARFWDGIRSSLPAAEFHVYHVIGRHDEGLGVRAAVRWSITGTHSGPGRFGEPSGATVHVMGISHAEYGPGGLRREFVLFDEVAVWNQILLHRR